jgi:hypothetical protein
VNAELTTDRLLSPKEAIDYLKSRYGIIISPASFYTMISRGDSPTVTYFRTRPKFKVDAEYMTRPEFAFYSKQPYSTIMDYIRRGEIEMFLINGQIKINVAEATRVLEARIRKPRLKMDLFA